MKLHRLLITTLATAILASVAPTAAQDAPPVTAPPIGPDATIPEGHPPLDQMTTQPPAAPGIASVAVRAVQGTKDGPPIANVPVSVDLVMSNSNQLVEHLDAQLDEHGVIVFENLNLTVPVTPIVKIEYGGVSYATKGQELNSLSPSTSVDVTVYETTLDKPDWVIPMRHVLMQPTTGGVQVTEMIVAENATDQTWLGGELDEKSNRTAVSFQIPPGAKDIQLTSGFHGWCCTKHVEDTIEVQMPLMPGQSSYRFSYFVPATGGHADITIAAPVTITNTVAFLPADGAQAHSNAMQNAGIQQMGPNRVQMFTAANLAPGTLADIHVDGVAAAATNLAQLDATTGSAKTIALFGGGAILIIGVIIVLLKSPRKDETPDKASSAGAS